MEPIITKITLDSLGCTKFLRKAPCVSNIAIDIVIKVDVNFDAFLGPIIKCTGHLPDSRVAHMYITTLFSSCSCIV
ncbi:hypothetical protein EB796_000879 [Bugula neritina]|uniref:Uncharacterized protein n=1 Tax=Bugula neritina TaxID=10212 RepID=A0A7J7J399_BUGNE|nr:hypothetical protein EB796_021029 [Bugula neritina]KAF6040823.1 hypothetical protein EB796_000879 [Bugula neritina]